MKTSHQSVPFPLSTHRAFKFRYLVSVAMMIVGFGGDCKLCMLPLYFARSKYKLKIGSLSTISLRWEKEYIFK